MRQVDVTVKNGDRSGVIKSPAWYIAFDSASTAIAHFLMRLIPPRPFLVADQVGVLTLQVSQNFPGFVARTIVHANQF